MLAGAAAVGPDGRVPYFAYGANMSAAKAAARFAARGAAAEPRLAGAPAQAVEPGLGLAFSHRGGYASLVSATSSSEPWQWQQLPGGGAAADERADGDAASPVLWQPHGVLYRLTPPQLQALASYEIGYTQRAVRVRAYGQQDDVAAAVFVSSWLLRLRRAVRPTQRYLDLLLAGAEEHALDPAYVACLRGVPTVEPKMLGGAVYSDTPAQAAATALAAAALGAATLAALH
jgi:hypothetical protein